MLETRKHNLLYVYADIKGQNVSRNCWKKKCTFESKASIQGRQGRKQMWFPIAATSGLWASIINRLWSLTPTHILALPHTNTSLLIFTWVLRMKRKCFWIKKGSFGLSRPTRLLIHIFANLSLSFIQRIAISILLPTDERIFGPLPKYQPWTENINYIENKAFSFLCFNLFHL